MTGTPKCLNCGGLTKHYGDFFNREYECAAEKPCGHFTLDIERVALPAHLAVNLEIEVEPPALAAILNDGEPQDVAVVLEDGTPAMARLSRNVTGGLLIRVGFAT